MSTILHTEKTARQQAQDAVDSTQDAVKSATDKSKEMVHSIVIKTEDQLANSKACMRRNPLTFLLGSVCLGAALGYLIVSARRTPTFRERFMDEPMETVSDALRSSIRSAIGPAVHHVQDGYHSARDGVERAMDQVHRFHPLRRADSLSDRIGRAACNLKFW